MKRKIRVVESIADLEKRLRNKGWSYGDIGEHGYVMLKGDLAWKITRSRDVGYCRYISQVASGRFSGPHVPRIRLVLKDREGRVAVLMERLEQTIYEVYGFDSPLEHTLLSIFKHRNYVGNWSALRWYCVRYRVPLSFFAFARRLTAYASRRLDIHGGNIMLRRDGTLVVIDPMS